MPPPPVTDDDGGMPGVPGNRLRELSVDLAAAREHAQGATALYLDLLTRVLCGTIYEDPPIPVPWLPHTGYRSATRNAGVDWPSQAHTMIGPIRLGNVRGCTEQVIADGIPGDLMEAGIWRGGTVIMMRAVLKAHGITSRDVWAADSFAGLPPASTWDPADGPPWDQADALAVTQTEVKRNFAAYGLLDEHVRFLPGWFADTLPTAPVGALAVLRMDADLKTSTETILREMEPKVSPGGYVIVDDYQLPGCREAVDDYRAAHRIIAPIQQVLGQTSYTVFWRKQE